MPERFTVGIDCKLYYNSATYATPTWVAIDNAQDVEIAGEIGEAPILRRGSRVKEYLAAMMETGLEFGLQRDKRATVYAALNAAYWANLTTPTPIEFAAMDEDIATSGATGIRMTCLVFKFSESEPLETGTTAAVGVKPTPNADAKPAPYTVS